MKMEQTTKKEFLHIINLDPSPEYIKSCLNGLTEIERAVLKVLYLEAKAMSIREIRMIIIADMWDQIFMHFRLHIRKGDMEKTKSKEELNKINYELEVLKLEDPNYFFSVKYGDASSIVEMLQEYNKQKLAEEKKKSYYDTIDKVNKILSKHKVITPSFLKIENALKSLNKLGLVIERESNSKRIKSLWFITPKLDLFLNKLKDWKKH